MSPIFWLVLGVASIPAGRAARNGRCRIRMKGPLPSPGAVQKASTVALFQVISSILEPLCQQ